MNRRFVSFIRRISTFGASLILALAVWVVAITSTDPTEERRFTNPISVELVGLSDGLVLTNTLPDLISVDLRAPASVWTKIINGRIPGKALIDVTGLDAGEYEIPVQIQIGIGPIMISSYSPQTAKIVLEKYETRSFDIVVNEKGEVPTAFKVDPPVLSVDQVQVSGSVSLLDQIESVRVVLDHSNATESIKKDLSVAAVNHDGVVITSGLKFSPEKVSVSQEINLRGGYRVVVVKVVTPGTVPNGYRVSKIGVDPSVVTIYSSDRTLLENLQSYLETEPVDLSTTTEDSQIKVGLNLPAGVSLVGDQTVSVNVEVDSIEGAMTLSDIPVYVIGLEEGVQSILSPEMVDVYLSGPQPILDQVKNEGLYAVLDLQDYQFGHYQLEPIIDISSWKGVTIQSIMPGTIDVTINGRSESLQNNNAQSVPASATKTPEQ
jgi:YbbR domain-containing protein